MQFSIFISRARRSGLRAIVVVALCACAPGAVRAFEGDTLNFNVFNSERYDDNLFALPTGVSPGGDGRRSAWTRTTGAGLVLDKTYGLQRILVDANLQRYHYDPYDNLDFTGHDITSTLQWRVTPNLSGNVYLDRSKLPTKFENTGFRTSPNPRNVERSRLDVDWKAGAALHPRFSLLRTVTNSEVPNFQLENSRVTSGEVSAIYLFRSTNTAEGYFRRGRGTNAATNGIVVPFEDLDFTEREYGGRLLWNIDGTSNLSGNLGYLKREYSTFAVRNFDGFVGHLRYSWQATGKTALHLDLLRTLATAQTSSASYCQCDYATASLIWNASSKITVTPSYGIRRKDFRGSPVDGRTGLVQNTRDIGLGITWSPLRALELSLNLGRSRREANDASFNYVDRTASVLGQFRF